MGKERLYINRSRQRLKKISLGLILLVIAVLLIVYASFFMFTTTMSRPTTMDLYMPKDTEKDSLDQFRYIRKKLTLILLKGEKVFGYYGDYIKDGQSVSLNKTGKLIADGWKMFSKDSLVVLIKPAKDATYKATVDILDQMTKNGVEKYSMADPNKKEKEFLKLDE